MLLKIDICKSDFRKSARMFKWYVYNAENFFTVFYLRGMWLKKKTRIIRSRDNFDHLFQNEKLLRLQSQPWLQPVTFLQCSFGNVSILATIIKSISFAELSFITLTLRLCERLNVKIFTKLDSLILYSRYYERKSLWWNKWQKSSLCFIQTEETQAILNVIRSWK
jgi:hypothetical protein